MDLAACLKKDINLMKQLTWEEVRSAHGSVAAIRQIEGKISSILCGGKHHSDQILSNEIIYDIPNRIYYKKSIMLFNEAVMQKYSFDVYRKIDTNMWNYLGKYFVSEILELDKEFKIVLNNQI
jgi:hypothetical protein